MNFPPKYSRPSLVMLNGRNCPFPKTAKKAWFPTPKVFHQSNLKTIHKNARGVGNPTQMPLEMPFLCPSWGLFLVHLKEMQGGKGCFKPSEGILSIQLEVRTPKSPRTPCPCGISLDQNYFQGQPHQDSARCFSFFRVPHGVWV